MEQCYTMFGEYTLLKTDKKRAMKVEWNILSKPWIDAVRNTKNSVRSGLLDPIVINACGNIEGQRILDCGCGEGRFSRIVRELKPSLVVGIDLCMQMVVSANKERKKGEYFLLGDAEEIRMFHPEFFDLAVSYLNQCDLQNFQANVKGIYDALRPGGLFVIANLHPMRSAVGKWARGQNNEKLHVILDNYFDESERHWNMLHVDFTNYHRTVSTYINEFIRCGFELKQLIEPRVNAEIISNHPDLDDELRVPNFIVYVLKKPN